MAIKTHIAQGKFKGGLINYHQLYDVNYLHAEPGLEDKIELAIRTPNPNNQYVYTSLRFQDPEHLRLFIIHLIRAYSKFMEERGLINKYTISTIPIMFKKALKKALGGL